MKRTRLFSVIVIVGLCAMVGKWLLFPGGVVNDANRVADALLQGDTKLLHHFVYEHQKVRLGLTMHQVEAVHRQLIGPRLAGLKEVGERRKSLQSRDSQGVVSVTLADRKEVTVDLTTYINKTPKGGRANFFQYLYSAWIVDYVISGRPKVPRYQRIAISEGLQKDRRYLEEQGIPGVLWEDPALRMRTWKEMEDHYRSVVAADREGAR